MRALLAAVILAGSLSVASAQVLSVSTLAGPTAGGGYLDAHGTAARFSDPRGVAVDASGNVYVADAANQVIRKITAAGDVSTFAAGFRFPGGIAVNQITNDVYVADTGNGAVRKITPGGTVSTVAAIAEPSALAVLPDGSLYVADKEHELVYKVTPAGVVSAIGGVHSPEGIAADALSGIVYVSSSDDVEVWKLAPNAHPMAIAGSYGPDNADGTGRAAHFRSPSGLALEANGNLVMTDRESGFVRRITPDGVVTTVAGAAAQFNRPAGIAADAAGNLYVADGGNAVIRKIASAGDVSTLAGSMPQRGAPFTFPAPNGVAVDDAGNTYVADASNTIKRVSPAGVVTTIAAGFNAPAGLAVDRRDGSVVVADSGSHTIRRVTPQGAVTTIAGRAGEMGSDDGTGTAATFAYPLGVFVDAGGNIYVADSVFCLIRKISPAGVVKTIVYLGNQNVGITTPTSIAVDAAGTIYFAEYDGKIKTATPGGITNLLVDLGGLRGDGVEQPESFVHAYSIALAPDGNLCVADRRDHVIRRVTPAGAVTTIAGVSARPGNVNGNGIAARFASPVGIAFAPDGRLVIADEWNHAIRIGTFIPTVRVRAER